MRKLPALAAALILACSGRAQTTGFTNVNVKGTLSVTPTGTLTIASGATWTDPNLTTNQLLYMNSGGFMSPLTLGAGLSISGGTLTAGSSTSANPSALVGTSTINGSANTFMRSDAAPGVNLAMVPTWTGLFTWSPTLTATVGTDYVLKLTPTLNQRNATNCTALYINETITQAGSGNQYFIECATGGGSPTDFFDVDTLGNITLATWHGTAIPSAYGGTGLTTFTQGSLLVATAANTWGTLSAGTANYVLTGGGAGVAPSYQGLSGIIDTLATAAQGDILYRNGSVWTFLAPGTSGQVLETLGASANPAWTTVITAPGTTTTHDVASYSNATGNLEDTGLMTFTGGTSIAASAITTITASDSASNGVLRVVNTTSSASTFYSGSFLDSNLAVGAENIVSIGGLNTSNNAAYIGFHYAGSGSGSNFLSMGFAGNADLFEMNPAGLVTTKALTATGAVIMNAGTASTTTGTGTLVITGGEGVSGQVSSGGLVVFNTSTAAAIQGEFSAGGTAYTFGALPSGATTSGPAINVPATTYTVTGTNTATAFQANYEGAATITDASAGAVTDLFDDIKAGPAAGAGSLVVTRAHTLGILDSTSASSSITGGFIVATTFGTSATSVGIGGGNINAGGTLTVGGVSTLTGALTQTAKTTTYNNVATAGIGVTPVVSAPRSTAVTNATTSLSAYTTPASDTSYEVSANVNVTATTAAAMTVTCTYTDETNASRTLTLGFAQLTGATLITSITNVTGTGPYESITYHIRCKASTTIQFATAGTVTGITYNIEGSVVQLL